MDPRVSHYKRLVRSIEAEQILSRCTIRINVDTLRPHIIGNNVDKNSDPYRYMKNASAGGGFVQTEYSSLDKVTARMFTKKGCLNLITLSNKAVMKSMDSRFPKGKIVCLDYKAYEPSIIRSILGDVMPEDIHKWATDTLMVVPRGVVKLINMQCLYAKNFETMIGRHAETLVCEHGCDPDDVLEYVKRMDSIHLAVEEYLTPLREQFDQAGYITNKYGRKVFPKDRTAIFNTVIQSIGSEIIIEAIINLSDTLKGKEAVLLFHRFDALYFDMGRDALIRHLGKIIKTMESADESVALKVGIQLGDTLASLEEIDSG